MSAGAKDIGVTEWESRTTDAAPIQVLLRTMSSLNHGLMFFGPDRRMRLANRLGLFCLDDHSPRPGGLPTASYDELAARAVTLWRQLAQKSGETIAVDSVLELDTSRAGTTLLTLPQGRQIEFSVTPSDDGGFVVVSSDVTEFVNARTKAESAARELRNLIDAIPGILVRKRRNQDGTMVRVFVSDSVTLLTGYSVEQAMSPGWWFDNVAKNDLEELKEQFDRVFNAGAADSEFRFRCRDRRWIWIRASMRRAIAPDGQVEAICIWNDVTAEREQEAQLTHATMLMHMGEVATGMAHELNQPLTSISIAAENAQRALDSNMARPGQVQEKLKLITSQAHRAAALIEHLQVFGRSRNERVGTLRWQDVIRNTAVLVEATLAENTISLENCVPDDLPPVIGRMSPLEQVLINLIKNSAEAYERHRPDLVPLRRLVRFEAEATDQQVLLRVRDFAGGIPEPLIERMFEPFFTTKPVGSGTGLGLSMTYGIIADVGGSISVHNDDDGAVFEIRLLRAASKNPTSPA